MSDKTKPPFCIRTEAPIDAAEVIRYLDAISRGISELISDAKLFAFHFALKPAPRSDERHLLVHSVHLLGKAYQEALAAKAYIPYCLKCDEVGLFPASVCYECRQASYTSSELDRHFEPAKN